MKDILLRLEKKEKMEKEQEEINEPNKDSPGKRIGAERVEIQRRGSFNSWLQSPSAVILEPPK